MTTQSALRFSCATSDAARSPLSSSLASAGGVSSSAGSALFLANHAVSPASSPCVAKCTTRARARSPLLDSAFTLLTVASSPRWMASLSPASGTPSSRPTAQSSSAVSGSGGWRRKSSTSTEPPRNSEAMLAARVAIRQDRNRLLLAQPFRLFVSVGAPQCLIGLGCDEYLERELG